MSWLALSFELQGSQADTVVDALLEAGALSVEITDALAGTAQERPLFGEPGAESDAAWRTNRVSVLFDAQADVKAIAHAALAAAGVEAMPQLRVSSIAEQDWVRASQDQFTPIQISAGLWIVPSWCEVPDSGAINLRLDPGLAFGTGAHPTTWQCLRWLEANLSPAVSVLDYGCGSGVLAIAAKRLGAGRVVAVDIDPGALQASRDNARLNAVEIEVSSPDAVPPGPYDVVVANILSNPLRLLAPLLAAFQRRGGRVVLAGILSQQAQTVAAAYASWYDVHVASEKDGWTCLTGARRL
jgi:ribosomal protein L11 methyltransferase